MMSKATTLWENSSVMVQHNHLGIIQTKNIVINRINCYLVSCGMLKEACKIEASAVQGHFNLYKNNLQAFGLLIATLGKQSTC